MFAARADFPVAAGGAALVCLALAALPVVGVLACDRSAVLAGEIWRLWSGHLVHFSPAHLLLDVTVLAVAGAVAERELGSRFVLAALAFGMPVLAALLLLAEPSLAEYRGCSGIAVLLAAAAMVSLWRRLRGARRELALLGAVFAAKVALDAAGFGGSLGGLPPGVAVAWQAHLLGALLGAAAAYVVLRRRALNLSVMAGPSAA